MINNEVMNNDIKAQQVPIVKDGGERGWVCAKTMSYQYLHSVVPFRSRTGDGTHGRRQTPTGGHFER